MFQKKKVSKKSSFRNRETIPNHPLFLIWLCHKLSKHQSYRGHMAHLSLLIGPPLILSFYPLIWHSCVHKRENYLHTKERCPSKIEIERMGESEMPTQISSSYRWVFFFFFLNFKTVHFLFKNDKSYKSKTKKNKTWNVGNANSIPWIDDTHLNLTLSFVFILTS